MPNSQSVTIQEVIDLLPIRIFWKDKNLRYLGCNQAFAEDAGKTNPSELLGKDDFEMTWKDQAEMYRKDDKEVMASGKPRLNYEEPQTTPDGNTIWLRTSKVPLVNENGEVEGILGSYADITQQQKTEERIRKEQVLTQKIIESLPGIFYMVSSDGGIVRWNENFVDQIGYSDDEMQGRSALSFFEGQDKDNVAKVIHEVLSSKKAQQVEADMVTKAGEHKPYFFSGTHLVTDEKPYIVGMGFDISDRREAERQLVENERKYRSLIDNIPYVVWTTSEEGNTVFISPQVGKIMGYTDEEYCSDSKNWTENIHPDDKKRVLDTFHKFFRGEGGYDVEYQIKKKDGSWIWIQEKGFEVFEKDGVKYANGIFSDITKRKEQEEVDKARLRELEVFYKTTVNRELEMAELKQRLEELEKKQSSG